MSRMIVSEACGYGQDRKSDTEQQTPTKSPTPVDQIFLRMNAQMIISVNEHACLPPVDQVIDDLSLPSLRIIQPLQEYCIILGAVSEE